jgi:hypothetical protein
MDAEKIKNIRILCKQYEKKELKIHVFMDALEKEGIPCWIAFVIGDLHRKVSYLTNIDKLDAEDRVIAEKWEKERDERAVVYDQLSDAETLKDNDRFHKVLDQLTAGTPSHCEHERSIWSHCYACEEIERTLFPDMFEPEEDD